MSSSERIQNVVFGVNLLALAAVGLVTASPAERASVARIGVTLLNTLIGVLFLLRQPLVKRAALRDMGLCLPSFVAAGWAFRAGHPLETWPWHANLLFAIGTTLAAWSLLTLGRSFAVLPALRGVVTAGPYRAVRHPAYLGELVMVTACVLGHPSLQGCTAFLVAIPAVAIRIHVEENLLQAAPQYDLYRAAVRWKLVPGVW